MEFNEELERYMKTTLNPVRRKSWNPNKFLIIENRKDYVLYDNNMRKIVNNESDPKWLDELSKNDWEKIEGVQYV